MGESSQESIWRLHWPSRTGLTARLWLLALLSYGLGDLLTTLAGLSSGPLVEASPFVIPVIERFGIGALLGLKTLVFGITGLLWWHVPYPHSLGVPLGLCMVGIIVTGWNTALLLVFGL